jgi:hypothetical protein
MTPPPPRGLVFADPGGARALAAFLGRLLRWEKGAAVRLQAAAGTGTLGVFARPARFEVLAVLTAPLRAPAELDVTVSAGELLEGLADDAATAPVPAPVTGPSWAGMLPPRGGWSPVAELPAATVRQEAAAVIAEFRSRTEALAPEARTREAVDAVAAEVWERPLRGTELPLRAVHAAHALGFLTGPAPVAVLGSGPWLRLRTPYGSVAARPGGAAGTLGGLGVTPL